MVLNVLDLFSGIGGFALGLERTGGFRIAAFCESNLYCQAVLRRHWASVPIFDDVRTLDAAQFRGIDVITGGFPCQDISAAGAMAGLEGDRSGLWSELCRLIGEIRPRFAIVENVPNLLAGPTGQPGGWFGRILGDLAAVRFDAEWHCIPSSAIGAAFEGDRVWMVATPNGKHGAARLGAIENGPAPILTPDRFEHFRAGLDLRMATACGPLGNLDGFSDFVDRRERTAAIGNSNPPQIPEIIGQAILASMESPT